MRYEQETEDLFDALTDYNCTSVQEIADVLGWAKPLVGDVLSYVRKPDTVSVAGWTVPHVRRGKATPDRIYRVILTDDDAALTDEEHQNVLDGATGTLGMLASLGENEGQALRRAAVLLEARDRRWFNRMALTCEATAAQARDILEKRNP